ncbi:hypothetical protein GCM10018785_72240 [Streptomyces longispororuber]|uniref:DUF4232 domain-containing protein n=1 Tax=Streptomyces longispororuber TaxID=68230 RepID=A0A919AAP5_9ACTN|nr:DUF4232 domain-containing protein [Streptomyces longispororuber]GHE97188.1 hypothetical protein GCM10018785_72240 [Streptomyces longispororuber]
MTLLPHRPLGTVAVLAAALLATGCGRADRHGSDDGRGAGAGAGVPSPLDPSPAPSVDDGAPRYGFAPSQPTRDCTDRTGTLLEAGPVESAMGLRAMTVWLTHCGAGGYLLDGYPVLQVLGEDGTAYDVHSLKGTQAVTTAVEDPGPHPVALRTGDSATVSVVWRNTYTDTTEDPVKGERLQVLPRPGGPAGSIAPEGGIDIGSTGRIGVTAWQKAPPAPTGTAPTAPGPSTPAS